METLKWFVHRMVIVVVATFSILTLVGCSTLPESEIHADQKLEDSVEGENDENDAYSTNFIWHDSDSFETLSPTGTFVRAYIESMLRMDMEGGRGELFPGTEDATQFDLTPIELAAIDHPVGSDRRRGAKDLHVISVSESGSLSEVIICEDPSRVAEKSPTGEWKARGSDELSFVNISRLVLDKTGVAPPSNVVGSAQSPSSSMFGDWKALEYQPDLDKDSIEARGIDYKTQCLNRIGKEAATVGGIVVPEPPVEAPDPAPGWPEGRVF